MDIEKELKELKDRLAKIEGSLKKSELFGSSYSNSGSTSSDYLIKTRGKVKIQIGNKFIDLVKDGKINVDSSFIFRLDSIGSKDGIYVTGNGEDTKTTLVVGNEQIELQGEIGNTYVSFLAALETTGDLKYLALTNIGFIQKDKTSIDNSPLLNGIIYIESEKKLYTVVSGLLAEYSVEFPNPYPKLFVLAKDDKDEGSLLILGTGSTNGIKFDNLIIYNEDSGGYFNTSGNYLFNINDSNIIRLSLEGLTCYKSILSDKIISRNASDASGFRLYATETESTLEVDNIIARNGIEANCIPYPEYYGGAINSIESFSENRINDVTKVKLSLRYKNTYKVGDIIVLFDKLKVTNLDKELTITLAPFEATITEVDGQTVLFETSENYRKFCEFVFLKKGIHVNSNKLEFIDDTGVNTIVGDISTYKIKNEGQEESISGNGIYSSNSVFDKAQYSSNYHLDSNDNSSRFASTEWVLQNSVPTGTIVMFSGLTSTIPSGWHICDGTNGTPNLIGKFIKADSTSGITGGSTEIQLSVENIPKHTHTITDNVVTSEAGEHTHTIKGKYGKLNSVGDNDCIEEGTETDLITTSSSGGHTHTIDMGGILLSYYGEGKPLKWEPSFYSLIFIMKIK